jgi:peroxiredoxin
MSIAKLFCKGHLALFSVILAAGNALAASNAGDAPIVAPKKATAAITSKSPPSQTDKERNMKSLTFKGLDGGQHSLTEWKNKVVVVNFWASWCPSCLYEIRDFVAYQEQYQVRGLQFIGVGLDQETKLRNVQRTLEINYPVLIADPAENSELMPLWGNSSGIVPYTVVIDRNGQVSYVQRGPLNREAFDEYVLPLLDKPLERLK